MKILRSDVLVIGGGTAGYGAALTAAQNGLDVILIEASQKIGGVMAACPGMPWGGGFPVDQIIGGVIEDLFDHLANMTPPAAEKRYSTLENFGPEIIYSPDMATLVMFEKLEQAGVRVLLETVARDPVMEGARIAKVQCTNRLGPFDIAPKIVIDCSGDGDISAKAGVPYHLGDPQGNMMAVTMSFHMMGADWDRVFAEDDPYFERFATKGVAEGRLHPDLAQLYLMRGYHRGDVFCNSVHIRGVDGTDPEAVACATQEGRRRCHQLAQFLQSDIPGFEDAFMTMLSPNVGVRETRKLQGIIRVTGADLAKGTKFADGIVACDNPVDDVMRADGDMTHHAALTAGDYYTIPMRSLMPEAVQNLMFAGRILSADSVAFASVRGMPQCMAMGQACANAALLAINNNTPIQEVDLAKVVVMQSAQGVNRLRA